MTLQLRTFTLFFLFSLARVSQGDLVISISQTFPPAGQDGFVDVTMHSDSGSGNSLTGFIVSYEISAPGLEFFTDAAGNPDQPQLGNPNYVFFGNSLEANGPPVGAVSSTSFVNDTYTQDDATANGAAVSIGSTDTLLATLHLVATQSGPYTINIDPVNSEFFDVNGNPIPFTTGAVPEPTSFLLYGLGTTVFLGALRLQRKRTV